MNWNNLSAYRNLFPFHLTWSWTFKKFTTWQRFHCKEHGLVCQFWQLWTSWSSWVHLDLFWEWILLLTTFCEECFLSCFRFIFGTAFLNTFIRCIQKICQLWFWKFCCFILKLDGVHFIDVLCFIGSPFINCLREVASFPSDFCYENIGGYFRFEEDFFCWM